MNKITIYTIIAFWIFSQKGLAQKKEDTIGTEIINVVKPYTPTISDAFKIKEVLPVTEVETTQKEVVKYQIFSFPVASTFVPSKGKATSIEKIKQEKLWSNYIAAAYGNYNTLHSELFITHDIDDTQYLGGTLRYLGSGGGISGVSLNNGYADLLFGGFYSYTFDQNLLKVDASYNREGYNWYGLPIKNPNFNGVNYSIIKPQHLYNTLKADAELIVSKSFFNKMNIRYIGFSDDYNSSENRFILNPRFNFDINQTDLKLNCNLDYVTTSFDKSFQINSNTQGKDLSIQQSSLIFSIHPSLTFVKDDLSIDFGAELSYLTRLKNIYSGIDQGTQTGFYFYPKIYASYKVVGDLMVANAGAEGGLEQQTYQNFANQNKFLSPTLDCKPSDRQYALFLGLNGKLANTISYHLKSTYESVKNKSLFVSNPYLSNPTQNYSYGNSFNIVYDDLKNLSFFGELKADLNKDIALGINALFNSYQTANQLEAWNLPIVKIGFLADFNIGEKFYAGTQFFYVGERKDQFKSFTGFIYPDSVQNVDPYFDMNLDLGYKHNERLTFFIKGNNLANQNYQRWLNYPVQGMQIIGGVSYKFDL
ncbi:TonB-dependent receptor [Flavobacterium oreochromis]|uniref:TonB-dependent receptor n=1 Tax=Flavobacterium oreochromis TaxID=2906078 RepID=A0ABW8P9R2_9FLAO|nr:TonB-dependent receptor [Flavobacterium oreochromis]OWP76722.1 TonB-dependent receptor [Flavobacterium oreochromis]POR22993.1 TonB-dependent receptor [Flavobacterium columnare]